MMVMLALLPLVILLWDVKVPLFL
jgi:hypothetical protein